MTGYRRDPAQQYQMDLLRRIEDAATLEELRRVLWQMVLEMRPAVLL